MRFLFWKALFGLLTFDLFLLGRDFARLHRIVHNWRVSDKKPPTDATDQVCSAVNHACIWYPKRALCLKRSAVTTCLMRSCGMNAQMVIGAQKLPFKAHAWVEVDGRVVNDKPYTPAMYGVLDRC